MPCAETETDRSRARADRPIQVLIVDDHCMVARSLATLLDDEPDLCTVGTAHDAASALDALARSRVDVVVLDRRLGAEDGIALGTEMRALAPGLALLLLSADLPAPALDAAIGAGFSGALDKAAPIERLLAAIRDAALGQAVVSPADLARLRHGIAGDAAEALTAREMEILALMAEALPYKAIAGRVFLSVNTVRKHVQSILSKLGAHSRLECVLVARQRGLIELR